MSADLALAGTDTVAIGSADLNLVAGTATFVHAIGSAEKKNLSLAVFTISGLGATPDGVAAGTGPVDRAIPVAVLVLVLVAGSGLLAVSVRRLAVRR